MGVWTHCLSLSIIGFGRFLVVRYRAWQVERFAAVHHFLPQNNQDPKTKRETFGIETTLRKVRRSSERSLVKKLLSNYLVHFSSKRSSESATWHLLMQEHLPLQSSWCLWWSWASSVPFCKSHGLGLKRRGIFLSAQKSCDLGYLWCCFRLDKILFVFSFVLRLGCYPARRFWMFWEILPPSFCLF